MASPRKKPRVAAYGWYVIDSRGIALRCWLDHKAGKVCCISCVVPRGNILWAYAVPNVNPIVVADLVRDVNRAGYRCFSVTWKQAQIKLEVRYDTQNPYQVSAGPEAGMVDRRAVPGKHRRRRGKETPGMFGGEKGT
jgi:hypothetical protein